MNPGIINIRPVLKLEASETLTFESRENKKIDLLFKDYYKHEKGMEISEELMAAFLDALNEEKSEGQKELLSGGDGIETEIP